MKARHYKIKWRWSQLADGLLQLRFREDQVEEAGHLLKKDMTIWEQYEKSALELIEAGEPRIGSKMICENIRKNITSGQGFALNNNLTSILARIFIMCYPKYNKYIELRAVGYKLRGIL